MSEIFWVATILWVVVHFASIQTASFRLRVGDMVKWLENQYPIIEEYPDFHEDAYLLHNNFIPQVKLWIMESVGYARVLLFIQGINTCLIFISMFEVRSYILYGVAAFANAAVIVSARELHRRRYIVEGICQGTKIILDAIGIQQETEKSENI